MENGGRPGDTGVGVQQRATTEGTHAKNPIHRRVVSGAQVGGAHQNLGRGDGKEEKSRWTCGASRDRSDEDGSPRLMKTGVLA